MTKTEAEALQAQIEKEIAGMPQEERGSLSVLSCSESYNNPDIWHANIIDKHNRSRVIFRPSNWEHIRNEKFVMHS